MISVADSSIFGAVEYRDASRVELYFESFIQLTVDLSGGSSSLVKF